MELTSTYNFVPLNKEVFIPDWAEDVSQDFPFSDGEDGIIEVSLHNVSPLFTRDGSADRLHPSQYSAHIPAANGEKLYFLPGTSLKGMFRSTLEILSFGKFVQYTDRSFGWRNVAARKGAYQDKMKNVCPALLRLDTSRDIMFLTPLDTTDFFVHNENGKKWPRISDNKLIASYPSLSSLYPAKGKIISGWQKSKAIRKDCGELYPKVTKNGKVYRIVCTGNMNQKIKEYLFPIIQRKEIEVPEEVRQQFETVYEPSPEFKSEESSNAGNSLEKQTIMDYLQSGRKIAVFYLPNKSGTGIKAIGLSQNLRLPYTNSIGKLVNKQQTSYPGKHDLAETIFGYISKQEAGNLRGRVQVTSAFADKPINDAELLAPVSGVLGQPKASFYPFYLEQDDIPPYKTYDNATAIAGRKLYRIHTGATVTDLSHGNDNENVKNHPFRPLPAGMTFRFKIAVHNLKKVEIGALLSAITLHRIPGAYHNLGLAKGYGYGKLQIDSIRLSEDFLHTEGEYLYAFEQQMQAFVSEKVSSMSWMESPQISKLVSILSEHKDSELRVMSLEQYTQAKKGINFGKLYERPSQAFMEFRQRKQMERAEERKEFNTRYHEIELLLDQQQFSEAVTECGQLIDSLNRHNFDTANAKALLNSINERKQDFERTQKIEEERRRTEQELRNARIQAGFAAVLDEKYIAGSNCGKHKIADYKALESKTGNWLKTAQRSDLTDDEKTAYAAGASSELCHAV